MRPVRNTVVPIATNANTIRPTIRWNGMLRVQSLPYEWQRTSVASCCCRYDKPPVCVRCLLDNSQQALFQIWKCVLDDSGHFELLGCQNAYRPPQPERADASDREDRDCDLSGDGRWKRGIPCARRDQREETPQHAQRMPAVQPPKAGDDLSQLP